MNQIQRIVKNIGVTSLSQIIIAFMGFILMIYLARFLGEADFGKYNFAFSLTTLIGTFADLGVNQLLVREIARQKEKSSYYVNNALCLKIILAIVTFILIVIITSILNLSTELSLLVYLFGIYNILLSISNTYLSLFQALEKMEYISLFQVIERTFITILTIIFLLEGFKLLIIGYIYLLGGVIDIITVFLITSKKFINPSLSFNFQFQKKIFIMALPFGTNFIMGMIFLKMDTVLLGILKDDTSVGIYNAAYNPLLSLSTIIATVISLTIYPIMSRYFIKNENLLKKITMKSVGYVSIISFPITVGCFVLAEEFIELLYGNGYKSAILPFQLLALFMPIRLISTVTGTLLSSIDKQRYRMISVCLGSLFNITLNLLLIPKFSYLGASISTILSEMFLYLLFIFYIKEYNIDLKKSFIKPLIAAVLMGLVVYILKDMNLLITISVSSLVYFIILFLLKTFKDDDKILLKNIFN